MPKPIKEDDVIRALLKMKPEPFTPNKDKAKASPAKADEEKPSK
jgi:hypothetical protein